MKAKKWISLALAAVMLLSLAACGGSKKPDVGGDYVSSEVPEYINTDSQFPIVK